MIRNSILRHLRALGAVLLLFPGTLMAQSPDENLDRYLGRDLAVDGRAHRANVEPLLPMACPPFYLRDEFGQIIDPAMEPGVSRPVSTRQTCGACHDYRRITDGYHFQSGADELYKEGTKDWASGPGFFGNWLLLYQRELAPKDFADPLRIDMTPYDWVAACGVCHPGGGPAEFDRGGKRYSDTMRADPGMRMALDGDYFNAQWDASGVVEADCFICHLKDYDYSTRAQQLKKRNYQHAATAAAGLASVEGAVSENQIPKLAYRAELFGADGKVRLGIQRPADRACQFCHEIAAVERRGTTWHSHYGQDIHTQRGIRCIDCHPGDIRHQFAKGESPNQHVRDDLDGTALTCSECHENETLGAPNYTHPGLPPLHFEHLSCEACHITRRGVLAAQAVDTLTGKAIQLPAKPAGKADNFVFGAWWGKVLRGSTEGFFVPLSALDITAALNHVVTQDDALRKLFRQPDGSSRLPAQTFTVHDFLEKNRGAESEDGRRLLLAALSHAAQPDTEYQAACIHRGACYVLNKDRLVQAKTKLEPPRVGAIGEYPVAYGRAKGDGLIYPELSQAGVYWAYVENGKPRPLFLADMKAAWDFLAAAEPVLVAKGEETPLAVWDDNNDRWPEANTEREIGLVGWALTRTLTRLSNPELLYVRGASAFSVRVESGGAIEKPADGAYLVLKQGKDAPPRYETPFRASVRTAPPDKDLPHQTAWTISHGVEPASQALGAGGCGDCHSRDSHFFFGEVVADPFTPDVTPAAMPMYAALGYPRLPWLGSRFGNFELAAWREQHLKPLFPYLFLFVLALMMVHYTLFGARRSSNEAVGPELLRFRFHERLIHLATLLPVIFLCVTGFSFLLGRHDVLGEQARRLHAYLGIGGTAAFVLMFLIWVWFMFPARGDVTWLLRMGGYLGGKGHYPAGKFNAGQKLLFWATAVLFGAVGATGILMWLHTGDADPMRPLLYTVHDAAGALIILALAGHVYLAAIVNPHSIRSLFGGRVCRTWAEQHHPNWRALKKAAEREVESKQKAG